jgi:PAS domain S-box-containing protein
MLTAPRASAANAPAAVLLVDDIPANLIAMEALLERDDTRVLKASSGREALELLLREEVAVALVDVHMPEMDGFELAKLIRGRADTRDVPILFVTAAERDPRYLMRGYDAGAVDFLFKPIEPKMLSGKVDVFVQLWRNRRQLAAQVEAMRLAAIAFETHEAIVLTDAAGRIVKVNCAFTEITGYSEAEVLGQNPRLLQSGRHDAAFYRALWAQLRRDGHWEGELWNRRKDGVEYCEWKRITAVSDAEGRTTHYVGVGMDVTERKHAEDELRRMHATLERRVEERTAALQAANAELAAFSYSVSHDLKAPVRAIDGFAQLLAAEEGERLSRDGHGYLQRVRNAAARMSALIDGLLTLSNIGRSPMNRMDFDLSALAQEVAAERVGAEANRHIDVQVASGIRVNGDPGLVRVLLENLLGNAVKYSLDRDPATITVGVVEDSGEQMIELRDNGVGFDMTYADKLFAPFQRLHTDARYPGTGIGLATVARIVHRHGGRITGQGVPDKGACFRFTLGRTPEA